MSAKQRARLNKIGFVWKVSLTLPEFQKVFKAIVPTILQKQQFCNVRRELPRLARLLICVQAPRPWSTGAYDTPSALGSSERSGTLLFILRASR
jgi:hypothetical protein